ncbi:MAG: PD40 domain-containing protein [Planctomycetes bacterium]|nr:PD40 domain-containing protein [Planctomycetota bacterium]
MKTCVLAAAVAIGVGACGGGGGSDSPAGPSGSLPLPCVAFQSAATNLVAGDTNGERDIFLRGVNGGPTLRINRSSDGAEAVGGMSLSPAVTPDGRFVAFHSSATNLVPGDTNGVVDVFVHDVEAGATTRVSVDSSGAEGNGSSVFPAITPDGRYVAFHSWAPNLVAGDTNGELDVFLHDRQTGQTVRVSVDSGGGQALFDSSSASISTDGRYVAFTSYAPDLVPGDSNGLADIFVRDLQTGTTERVSLDGAGGQAVGGDSYEPVLSSDGRYVAFHSWASNLVAGDTNADADVFVHDRQTGATTRVSVSSAGAEAAGGPSYGPSISADGRYVAFDSTATNLVAGDTNGYADVFVHDRQTGETVRISLGQGGAESAGGDSIFASLSPDGRYVAFESTATNLVAGDGNGKSDIFVYDRETGVTVRVSVSSEEAEGNGHSNDPATSRP